MIRRLSILIGIATLLMAGKCARDGDTLVISEACETAYKLFYQDGRFTFTDEEIDHLRPVNVDKLSNFKRWFKSECPEQYARTRK